MLDLHGKTAMITGASAGLGAEMARLLGPRVSTLVLVARRRDRLEELQGELQRANPELSVIVQDVDLVDRPATGAMLDGLELSGVVVDVLINNAGFGDYGLFEDGDWLKTERMLELNMVGLTYLLHRLVPAMVRRKQGAVLNVGSLAGIITSPGMGTYAATKAYVNHLSEGLRAELSGTGVTVTVLCPGPVKTEFQEVAGTGARPPMPEAFYVDAKACAESAIDGLVRGKARVIPGGPVRAVALSVETIPRAVLRPILASTARRLRRH